ncbi:MAG: hypothetical protein ACE5RN_08250 [Nitrosopumilaceae archaeon]
MNKIIIPVIAGILLVGLSQNIYAPEEPEKLSLGGTGYAKAVPDWVDNNFRWYGEGKIGQSDLINSLKFMLDNGIMHLSDKAAQEMQSLREENAAYKKKLAADGIVGPKTMTGDMAPGAQLAPSQTKVLIAASQGDETVSDYCATTATQKYTDENGNDFLMVPVPAQKSTDDKSSCWVRVSQTKAGDPDRPLITGQVPNSDDRPTEEVAFYYNKISTAHKTVNDILAKGGTASAWEDGIKQLSSGQDYKTVDSVAQDLQGVVVLCSTAIDKEILKLQAEVGILEELQERQSDGTSASQYNESDLEFIKRHASQVDDKIKSLKTGLDLLEDKLATIGDDAQMANMDLQNALQKQQQALNSLSSITKSMNEMAMGTIRNMG